MFPTLPVAGQAKRQAASAEANSQGHSAEEHVDASQEDTGVAANGKVLPSVDHDLTKLSKEYWGPVQAGRKKPVRVDKSRAGLAPRSAKQSPSSEGFEEHA